eukprot:6183138-Pleurochrysis_carterae.AAC.4
MNPTLRRFWASPRSCLPEWRLACEARSARAFVRSVRGQGSTRLATATAASGGGACARYITRDAQSQSVAGESERAAYSRSCTRSSASSAAR